MCLEVTSHRSSIAAKAAVEERCALLEGELEQVKGLEKGTRGGGVEVEEVLRLRKEVDERNQRIREQEEIVRGHESEMAKMRNVAGLMREKEKELEVLTGRLNQAEKHLERKGVEDAGEEALRRELEEVKEKEGRERLRGEEILKEKEGLVKELEEARKEKLMLQGERERGIESKKDTEKR